MHKEQVAQVARDATGMSGVVGLFSGSNATCRSHITLLVPERCRLPVWEQYTCTQQHLHVHTAPSLQHCWASPVLLLAQVTCCGCLERCPQGLHAHTVSASIQRSGLLSAGHTARNTGSHFAAAVAVTTCRSTSTGRRTQVRGGAHTISP